MNVTVPFKNSIIKYLDKLSEISEKTQSVNTVYKFQNKIYGHNTDSLGFSLSLEQTQFKTKGKIAFILGAGGVTSSIVYALRSKGDSEIYVTNRTREKAENLKKIFSEIKILEWGQNPLKFDIIHLIFSSKSFMLFSILKLFLSNILETCLNCLLPISKASRPLIFKRYFAL